MNDMGSSLRFKHHLVTSFTATDRPAGQQHRTYIKYISMVSGIDIYSGIQKRYFRVNLANYTSFLKLQIRHFHF